MSAGQGHYTAQQLDRAANSKLALALLVSLLLHGSGYGIYEIGSRYHLWDKVNATQWLQKISKAIFPPKPRQNPPQREESLMFVNVNPEFAVVEAPKDAKYYAAQNTRKSNPDPDKDTDVPKISGREQPVMRTEDSKLSKAEPLQPAPPKPEPKAEKTKPEPAQKPGDLALAKPPEERKPRTTVAEAKAKLAAQQKPSIASDPTKQDGGVRQRNIASSLDAVGSPFGVYDAAVLAAIQDRWYRLLEERGHAMDRAGKVVLEFRLNYDGRITDMKVVENTVDELLSLLCQKAVLDPAPFAPWPAEMRRITKNNKYREVRITFYY